MHVIAFAPPPSASVCFGLAVVYAMVVFGVCWIAILLLRSVPNSHRYILWIPASACIGGLIAILVGPVTLREGWMEPWIGYTVEATLRRSLLGAASAAFSSSVMLLILKSLLKNGRMQIFPVLLAMGVCVPAIFAVSLQSLYVAFFVTVQITVLAATNLVYILWYAHAMNGKRSAAAHLTTETAKSWPEH